MNSISTADIAMEVLIDIRNAQPPKDRLRYIDTAIESMAVDSKGNIIQKLYNDMIARSNIDFGKIPNSRGDFSNFGEYQVITEAIGYLNTLLEGKNVKELTMTNRLFDFIVSARSDFEFGFKFDIEIIKLTYNTAVTTLIDMVNLCISGYMNYLKDTNNIKFTFGKIKPKEIYFVKYTESLLMLYESGEWTTIVKQFKGKNSNLFGFDDIKKFGKTVANTADAFVNMAKPDIFKSDAVKELIDKVPKWVKPVLYTVGSIIALIAIIRLTLSAYYKVGVKINDKLNITKDFVDQMAKNDSDMGVKQQQMKLSGSLSNAIDFMETKWLKLNNDANKDIQDSNKEFSLDSLDTSESAVHGASVIHF